MINSVIKQGSILFPFIKSCFKYVNSMLIVQLRIAYFTYG